MAPQEKEEKFTVNLSDEEVAERTTELLAAMDAIDAYEKEWEGVKTSHKAKAAGLEADRDRLRQVVRDHREDRVVKIIEQPDRELGVMRIIRSDTMDEIRQRPMTPDERQLELAVGSPQLSVLDGGKTPPPPAADAQPESAAGAETAQSEAVLSEEDVAQNDALAAEQAVAAAESTEPDEAEDDSDPAEEEAEE